MLHVCRNRNLPLDGALWYDTGWEWPEVVAHTEMAQVLTGVDIRIVRPSTPWGDLLARWGWPHWRRRWCSGEKASALDAMKQGCGAYVGLAADEQDRIAAYPRTVPVRFPLAEAGVTTADALAMCRRLGYDWGGLYEMGTRVSCFCCPFQSASTLRAMRRDRPEMFARLCAMHASLPDNVRSQGWKKGRTPEQVADGERVPMRGRLAATVRAYNVQHWRKIKNDPERLEAKRRKDRDAKRRLRRNEKGGKHGEG